MINLDNIAKEIEMEAEYRLEVDAKCPGGKTAKLHSVMMELDRIIGEIMRKEKLNDRVK